MEKSDRVLKLFCYVLAYNPDDAILKHEEKDGERGYGKI